MQIGDKVQLAGKTLAFLADIRRDHPNAVGPDLAGVTGRVTRVQPSVDGSDNDRVWIDLGGHNRCFARRELVPAT